MHARHRLRRCHCTQALTDAGINWQGDDLQQLDKMRCGVLIGTAMGGMTTFTNAVEDLKLKVRMLVVARTMFRDAGWVICYLIQDGILNEKS